MLLYIITVALKIDTFSLIEYPAHWEKKQPFLRVKGQKLNIGLYFLVYTNFVHIK